MKNIALVGSGGPAYTRVVSILRFVCRETGCLPSSWLLDAVVDTSVLPSSSGFSDVYQGHLGEDRVALKVLKVHVDDHAKVRKVSDASMVMSFPLANN